MPIYHDRSDFLWRVEYTASLGMSFTPNCIEYVWARTREDAERKVKELPGPCERHIYEIKRA